MISITLCSIAYLLAHKPSTGMCFNRQIITFMICFLFFRSCTKSWTKRPRGEVVWRTWRGSSRPWRPRVRRPLPLCPRARTLPSLHGQTSRTPGTSWGIARYNTSPRAPTVCGTFPWARVTPAAAAVVDLTPHRVHKALGTQPRLSSTLCWATAEPERKTEEDPLRTTDHLSLAPSWRRWVFKHTRSNQTVLITITC